MGPLGPTRPPPLVESLYSSDLGHDIVRDFLVPALSEAVQYRRITGDFSSAFLVAAARGLSPFFLNQGRMQLITNGRFTEHDVEAIKAGTSPEEIVERHLLEEIKRMQGSVTEFEKDHLRALTWLLRSNRLEMKVSLLRDASGLPLPATNPVGIQHTKVGIIGRSNGDKIAFVGGLNESMRAYKGNAEALTARFSWVDQDRKTIASCEALFDSLWNNRSPKTMVLPFPEAAKRQLISTYNAESMPDLTKYTEAPAAPSAPNLWQHQDQAVETFLQKRAGILEMATGTGKTRTALRISNELIEASLIKGIVIAASGNDLLDQWYREILRAFGAAQVVIFRDHESHRQSRNFLSYKGTLPPVLIISYENLCDLVEMDRAELLASSLLICDEVHNLGAERKLERLQGKLSRFPWRLGLSATPERMFDSKGTTFILSEIGPVVFKFGLEDAIERGILCEFEYVPLLYNLSDADKEKLREVHARFAALREEFPGTPMDGLYVQLAKVRKESLEKLPAFARHLKKTPQVLDRAIIFVETMEYGNEVQHIIHNHSVDYHTYYGDDDKDNLQRFGRGELRTLITCKRISEGIDIKSVRSVILFSADRAKLQTIQRIGRSLRKNPAEPEKRATVLDFVVKEDLEEKKDRNWIPVDRERCEWLNTLSKTRFKGDD